MRVIWYEKSVPAHLYFGGASLCRPSTSCYWNCATGFFFHQNEHTQTVSWPTTHESCDACTADCRHAELQLKKFAP